jgi:acetyltransferase-like isoleucine patch superfamily enzyme
VLIDYFCNTNLDSTQCLSDIATVTIEPLGTIICSEFEGFYEIEKYSCINRSSVGGYGGLGLHSYISDATIGRFTQIGSRVSIGGFEHPTDWLSVGAFQWGQVNEKWSLSKKLSSHLNSFPKPVPERTLIGSDCWIGNNVTILSGVKIADGSIVGAGSVVTKDLPPFSISVGNPAKVISYRFNQEIIDRLVELEWWHNELDALVGINFIDIQDAIDKLIVLKRHMDFPKKVID